jgi:transposase
MHSQSGFMGFSGTISAMRPKLFVRELTQQERETLESRLRSSDAFVVRRSQIILFSAEGASMDEIARRVGYSAETVRRVIHQFNQAGLDALEKKSRRPHRIHRAYTEENAEKLKALLHHSPREFGKPSSIWTLELLAEVSYEQGLTEKKVSIETVRLALLRLGVQWKRAKKWIKPGSTLCP